MMFKSTSTIFQIRYNYVIYKSTKMENAFVGYTTQYVMSKRNYVIMRYLYLYI